MQSLGLDVKVLDQAGEEIDLKQTFDDDDDVVGIPVHMEEELVADTLEGFGMEDEEGNPIADEIAEEESYFEVESFDSADDEQY